MNLRVIPNNKLYYVIKERAEPDIKRVMSPYKDKKIDFLALGFWVSSIVAAILAVPAIGAFVFVYTVFDNILIRRKKQTYTDSCQVTFSHLKQMRKT